MGRKTAVVTGGTSGLGEAASVALGRADWRVLVVGRDAERGADVAARAGHGSRFFCFRDPDGTVLELVESF